LAPLIARRVAASSSPGESKSQDTRTLDIHEDDSLDEAQLAAWMKITMSGKFLPFKYYGATGNAQYTVG
jgi:hypothetical protein